MLGRLKKVWLSVVLGVCLVVNLAMPGMAWAAGGTCDKSVRFFGLKPWYYELELEEVGGRCEVAESNFAEGKLADTVWKIILTILSDLLFFSGLATVGLVIYAGVRYILSAGDVGAATVAKKTLVGAIAGLVIVMLASVIVNLILGLF